MNLMIPNEAAEFLGMTPSQLSKLRDGKSGPPFYKLQGLIRFDRNELAEWKAREDAGQINGVVGVPAQATELPFAQVAACVYFLSLNQRVVYVGKSTSVYSRISQHRHTMNFDKVLHLVVAEQDIPFLADIELAFIKILKPAYNSVGLAGPMSKNHKRWLSKYGWVE